MYDKYYSPHITLFSNVVEEKLNIIYEKLKGYEFDNSFKINEIYLKTNDLKIIELG